ncbi:hypothetical protein Tco_0952078 [Tanacetum coccineum]|uniref:Uncharacterized protein n=1 Tax=Tanacetum coccineum TaxID=301880 RepID=A0ABQ5DYU7_9ASTR
MPRCIAWDKVDYLCPQSNPQVVPSFEVYTPPATYLKEVKETIRIPIEVEPLDHTKLEDLGMNTCRKSHLLEDKKIPSVGVFSTWMAFEGNTRDLGSFEEETDKTMDLHQDLGRFVLTECGDGVAIIKRRRQNVRSDSVRDFATASGWTT